MEKPSIRIKVALIGLFDSGKTSLIKQFIDKQFNLTTMTTIGKDVCLKKMTVQDELVEIEVWDTAGQERFRALTGSVLKGAAGLMLVYDVTNKRSFAEIDNWLREITQRGQTPKILLVGNKVDLDDKRQISTEKAKKYAQKHGMAFIETSALANLGVEEAFNKLVSQVLSESPLLQVNSYKEQYSGMLNSMKISLVDHQKPPDVKRKPCNC